MSKADIDGMDWQDEGELTDTLNHGMPSCEVIMSRVRP
jgi:hypothetical protein